MQLLPSEFLTKIARTYYLSEKQEEVFIPLFSNNWDQKQVADNLHISEDALRTRMSGVYRKFNINGNVPNKSRQLYDFLLNNLNEYNKNCSLESSNNNDKSTNKNINIDNLVRAIRDKIRPYIEDKQRCGTMKVLDMTQDIGIDDIYVNVNILETIPNRRLRNLRELQEISSWEENSHRLSLGNIEEQICGLTAVNNYPKLMVWGQPGSGKTTFLKYIAIECIRGNLQSDKIPLFITLRNFASSSNQTDLLTYIQKILNRDEIKAEDIEQLLQQGKFLILLDGLDEVKQEDSYRIIEEIQSFADIYYSSKFVITCRIAAKEYVFQGFNEVEVADFDENQIKIFVNNWFRKKDSIKAENFLNKIENNYPIKELATNPLLLTLLCLGFEGRGNFAENRSEIYREGIDVFLKKWDGSRNIERDQVYKNLFQKRKEDLLSKIAYLNFEEGNNFFEQETLENYIRGYIQNLPDAKNDPEALRLDGLAVLKSIEAQHGLLVERAKKIYSFSHLTFQEYFTARELENISDLSLLKKLASHVTDRRWREVFLLLTEMNKDSTELVKLMKQSIDDLVAKDEKIQEFLRWLLDKANSVCERVPYKPAAVRAFYLYRTVTFVNNLYSWIEIKSQNKNHEMCLELCLYQILNILMIESSEINSKNSDFFEFEMYLDLKLDNQLKEDFCILEKIAHISDYYTAEIFSKEDPEITACNLDEELKKAIHYSKELDLKDFEEVLRAMFNKDNNRIEEFRELIVKYRNIGHDWQFNEREKKLIQQYNNANNLLIDCLKSNSIVINPTIRQEIEDTLLLPIAKILPTTIGRRH